MFHVKAIPSVTLVVPSGVDLTPHTINLHCIPSMPIARHSSIGYARRIQEPLVNALITFACTLASRKPAFRRTPNIGTVVFKLIKKPVVQPQRHLVIGPIGIGLRLSYGFAHNLVNGRARNVVDRHNGRCPQIVDPVFSIHEIEVNFVRSRSSKFERKVMPILTKLAARKPHTASRVANALGTVAIPICRLPIARYIHPRHG